MPDQDWATEKAQDIYGGTHGDCCCDKHAQGDVGMIAAALRDAYQKGRDEMLETTCGALCSMCCRGMTVWAIYGHEYWHGDHESQRCKASKIRAAAEKEEKRE